MTTSPIDLGALILAFAIASIAGFGLAACRRSPARLALLGVGLAVVGVAAARAEHLGVPGLGAMLHGASAPYWLVIVGAFALGVGAFAALARAARGWTDRYVTPPAILAAAALGVVALGLGAGRAGDVKAGDGALEQLRGAGMGYDLRSLQNVLFFGNERGVELYLEAGFLPDDMLLALGRVSEFSSQEQLVFSILERAEEQASKRLRRGAAAPYERAERVRSLFHAALGERSDGFRETFDRYDAAGGRCRDASMPLMSYVVESGAVATAAALWGDPDDLSTPLLYGADIDWAEAGSAASSAGADPNPICEGRWLPARQAHLHGVVGPLFGLAATRAARGEPIGPRDRQAICAIAEGLEARGMAPASFIADELIAAIDDGDLPDDCRRRISAPARAAQSDAPESFGALQRSGYVVRAIGDGGCAVGSASLKLPSNGVRAYREPGVDATLWISEIAGKIGDEDVIGLLQQRGDRMRIIQGARGDLRATAWSAAPASLDQPLIAAGAGELAVLHADAASIRSTIADWMSGYGAETVRLTRGDGDDGEGQGEGDKPGDGQRVEGELQVDSAPLTRRLETDDEIGVEARVGKAPADLCLEFRSLGAASSETLASRFVAKGEDGLLRLRSMRPSDDVAVFAWPAGATAPVSATVSLTAVAPQTLECAPTRDAALALSASGWVEGARVGGSVAPGATEMFCPVASGAASEVSLTLTDLAADVDIEVLYRPSSDAAFESISSSIEGGSSPERIDGLFLPGDYLIRVYSADDMESPFTLKVESVNDAPDITDDYAPNDMSTAYYVGRLTRGGPPVEIVDAMFASGGGVADWFSFDVDDGALLIVTLDELNADLDIEILNERNEALASSILGASESERATAVVEPGRYFVKIEAAISFGASRYRLGLASRELRREDLGELAAGARVERSGALASDSPVAEFSFGAPEPGNVVVRLTGLALDADVTLENAAGDIIGESANGGAESELIEQYVAPGQYRVLIKLYEGDGTPFTVEISRP